MGKQLILQKAAGIMRREMHHENAIYEHPENTFPAPMLQFVVMIEHGADIMHSYNMVYEV